MDTPGTDIVRGKLKFVGKVHGAINMLETYYDSADFEFKQFVDMDQLEQYAKENSLVIIMSEDTQ